MIENSDKLNGILQELQFIKQQVASVKNQISELEGTKKALTEQSEKHAVYRQVGTILLEVSDRGNLSEEIDNTKVTLETHLARLESKENELQVDYEEILKSIDQQ
mgnify:CR=1 FL=1|tara:strand:- start:201 stop:515 length:315 start_codon:yes stop_codon:yes gene_type:complete